MSTNLTTKEIRWLPEFLKELSPAERKFLLWIFLISVLIRIVFVFEIHDTPFLTNLMSDSQIYNDWAAKIVDTNDWIGDSAFFMAPIYPYVLALLFFIFGKSILLVQIFQVLISSLTVVITYFVAKNFHSRHAGYIAASISCFYSIYIFYSGMILSETMQTLIVALLFYFMSKDIKLYTQRQWLIVGVLLGIAALFRANVLVAFVFIAFWAILQFVKKKPVHKISVKQASLFVLGTLLVIAPVTLRNFMVSKEFVLLTTNGGINFYIGNNVGSPGVFVIPADFDFFSDLSGQKYAEEQSGKKLTSSEASSFWYKKTFDELKKNPGSKILLFVKKIFLFFGESENPQSTIMDPGYFAETYSGILKLPLFGFGFISIFSFFGIYFIWRNRVNKPLFYLFVIGFVIGTVIFFVNGRFRVAIAPALIVFSSYGIYELIIRAKEIKFKEILIPAATAAAFLFVYFFLINRPVFNYYAAYLHLGDVAYENAEYEKAVENYNRSLFYKDFYLTYMNLGNAYAKKEDFRSAIAAYNRALSRKPNDLLTHFNLASVLTQTGKLDEGLKEFQKVLEFDPNYANAYRNIGIIYYVNEQYEDALIYFKKFLTLSKDAEINDFVRQDIENIKRKLREAAEKNK